MSEEFRKAFGKVHKMHTMNTAKVRGARAVTLFDLAGNELMRFVSTKECARHLGIDSQLVTHCLKGKTTSILNKSFTVKYTEDVKKNRPAPSSKMEIRK